MNIKAPGMKGKIKAFIRPMPQQQSRYLDLKSTVNSNEFSGQRSLVIGGSRGLGEVTAKLLAAGDAELKITYNQGAEDAGRIVEEISSNGGVASCFQFNILSPHQDILHKSLNNWIPTHLYYFATPPIFTGIKGQFSPGIFHGFCDYYVSGFLNTVNALKASGLNNYFYPLSVALDELPLDMAEYVAAKKAGEMLCIFLEKNNREMVIYTPKLVRMATDQTISLLPVDNQDPVPIMLQHLRLFRDASNSNRKGDIKS
jgi:hypothetical protein